MYKKIVIWIKNNVALFFTLIFALITLILWLCTTENYNLADLWLNLLAGFVATICTILVIDNIIKKQKQNDEKPIKVALYREVQLFMARIIHVWENMYIESDVNRHEITIDELFSSRIIEQIYNMLDLEGYPKVIPKNNWFLYLEEESRDLIERGNKILDRYISLTEPELFKSIHYLVNDSAFVKHLSYPKIRRDIDAYQRVPAVPILQSYGRKVQEKDYESVKTIIKWCNDNYDSLKDLGAVYEIHKNVVLVNPNSEPSSIIREDKIKRIYEEYREYSKKESK